MNTTMKNVFMLILGAALILSMAGAVSAALGTGEGTDTVGFEGTLTERDAGQTEVEITIDGQYTLTIPSSLTLSTAGESYSYVSLTSVALATGKTLTVTATSTNADENSNVLQLEGTQGQPVPYYLNLTKSLVSTYGQDTQATVYTSADYGKPTVTNKAFPVLTITSTASAENAGVTLTATTGAEGATDAAITDTARTVYLRFEQVDIAGITAAETYKDTLSFTVKVEDTATA